MKQVAILVTLARPDVELAQHELLAARTLTLQIGKREIDEKRTVAAQARAADQGHHVWPLIARRVHGLLLRKTARLTLLPAASYVSRSRPTTRAMG